MKFLSRLTRILTLKCDEASLLMSDSLDRKLRWHEWLALKGHFLACSVCPKLLKQLKLIRHASRNADRTQSLETGQSDLSLESKERLKRILRDAESAQ